MMKGLVMSKRHILIMMRLGMCIVVFFSVKNLRFYVPDLIFTVLWLVTEYENNQYVFDKINKIFKKAC